MSSEETQAQQKKNGDSSNNVEKILKSTLSCKWKLFSHSADNATHVSSPSTEIESHKALTPSPPPQQQENAWKNSSTAPASSSPSPPPKASVSSPVKSSMSFADAAKKGATVAEPAKPVPVSSSLDIPGAKSSKEATIALASSPTADQYTAMLKASDSLIDTVGAFYLRWKNQRKLLIKQGGQGKVSIFVQSVRPIWEDPANENGGSWSIRLPRCSAHDAEPLWIKTCIALLTDQLSCSNDAATTSSTTSETNISEENRELLGAVLSLRPWGAAISIWTRHCDGVHIDAVHDQLEKIAPGKQITFKPHPTATSGSNAQKGATKTPPASPMPSKPPGSAPIPMLTHATGAGGGGAKKHHHHNQHHNYSRSPGKSPGKRGGGGEPSSGSWRAKHHHQQPPTQPTKDESEMMDDAQFHELLSKSDTGNFDALGKTSALSDSVRKHLVRVYNTLFLMLVAASVGAYTDMTYHVGGLMTMIALFGSLFLFSATPDDAANRTKRFSLLMAFGFLKGVCIGPLVAMSAMIDPSIVVTALIATTCVFAAFSLAAVLSERRSFLYLGGILGSALSFMFFGALFSMFFPTLLFFNISLYLGLIVFSLFVIYDTQMIVERASQGHKDYMGDAMSLFIDFVAIFVRILIILSRNSKKRDDRRSRR